MLDCARGMVDRRVLWHHQGRHPWIAVDCIGLIVCAAAAAGIQLIDRMDYPMQPDLPKLLEGVELNADPIERDDRRVGDLIVFALGPEELPHLGLYAGDDHMIHTWQSLGYVSEGYLDHRWTRREHSWWRLRELV